MFSQFGKFVSDLEASVASNLPKPPQEASPVPQSTPSRGIGTVQPPPSPQSASQLADSALSSLRSSLRRGNRVASELSKTSVDGARSPTVRQAQTDGPSKNADGNGLIVASGATEQSSDPPPGASATESSGVPPDSTDERFALGDSSVNTPARSVTPQNASIEKERMIEPVEELPAKVGELAADPQLANRAPAVLTEGQAVPTGNAPAEALAKDPVVAPEIEIVPDGVPGQAVSEASPAPLTRSEAVEDPLSPHPVGSNPPAEPPPLSFTSRSNGDIKSDASRVSLDSTVSSSSVRPSMDASSEANTAAKSAKQDARFADISQAYKRLQADKIALEKIVRSTTSLSGLTDLEAFEDYLKNLAARAEMSMAEIKRLTIAHDQQLERIEEMRDTHRLEVKSQSEQIDQLKQQLQARDLAIKGHEQESAKAGEKNTSSSIRIVELEVEVDKARQNAKEEEEKRIKSVSLLKALRQKLVKAEKDKEEAEKDRESAKTAESSALGKLEADISSLRAIQEQQLNKLRSSYERETALSRAQFEREAAARKGQAELEAITTRATHQKELAGRDARLKEVDALHRNVAREKDSLFERLQVQQAEAESAREGQDMAASRTNELEIQLREAQDRAAAMTDELDRLRRLDMANADASQGDVDATRALLVEAEAGHLQRVASLEDRIRQLERERIEAEEDMSRQLQERLREVERMRLDMARKDLEHADSIQSQGDRQAKLDLAEVHNRELNEKATALEIMLEDARLEVQQSLHQQAALREESHDHERRAAEMESRFADVQAKETTLRAANKALREELRKVQSGMLMSDKQRNPGVGYFSNISNASELNGVKSPLEVRSPDAPTAVATGNSRDEAVNFEYIRNVILQFLEHKEMRPHLVDVLGVILRFTPQELRRLSAKATA